MKYMFKIEEYSQRIKLIEKQIKEEFANANIPYNVKKSNDNSLRLVFAGQYSAGKSSILKMLTGIEDIAIGAGITTQKAHAYEWHGLEVVDTPGIHTNLRPDHDEISYDAIATADMLVYVVTNELFDSHLAQHFRKLAIDRDKAGEMILVVNKMERASEGNTIQQQMVIKEDIKKVITPYTPEELSLCFLDAESYLDSLEERKEDPELADELQRRSGYSDFINTLNYFVQKKSLASKLTTKVYQMENEIQKALQDLLPKASDKDIEALEENFMQQRNVLSDARNRMYQEINDLYFSAGAKIRDIGTDVANIVVEGCKKDEVESRLKEAVREADRITEECQNDAVQVLERRLYEVGKEIDNIENSQFSNELKIRLSGKFDGLPDNVKEILGSVGEGAQELGTKVLQKSYKAGTNGGLKLTKFSDSSVHKLVKKAGESVGYKFKPWQATKISKGIAIAGEVLSIFGVILSVGMQIKSDIDDDQIRENLRKNRQNIRSEFNKAAYGLEDQGKKFVKENVLNGLGSSIHEIDENINDIRKSRSNRSEVCNRLTQLQCDCRVLIKDIHSV